MKQRPLLIIIVILAFLAYKYLFSKNENGAYISAVESQLNPFKTQKDNTIKIWSRAKEYLTDNKRLLGGGQLQENDSLLFLPY